MDSESRHNVRFPPNLGYGGVATITRPLQERIAVAANPTSRLFTPHHSKHSIHALGGRPQTPSVAANALIHNDARNSRVDLPRGAAIMNEWYNEWRTAPYDPLPSNLSPMNLLREPTWVHLDFPTHARQANDVLLVHYCPDMVPEARARQDLETENEPIRYLEEDAENSVAKGERALSCAAVARAAKRTDVNFIDLTRDGTPDRKAVTSRFRNSNTRRKQRMANRSQPSLHSWAPQMHDSCGRYTTPRTQDLPVGNESYYQMPPRHNLSASVRRTNYETSLNHFFPQYHEESSHSTFTDGIARGHALGHRSAAENCRSTNTTGITYMHKQ